MGKWTDKLYITHSEWASEFGGAKAAKQASAVPFKPLPHDHCALTLRPFETPVCAPDGTVFDLLHIVPYVERHGRNPVTGTPLKVSDLIRLKYARNAMNELYCPVTLKAFTDYSHIVANRRTGNVYSYAGVQEIASADGRWKDFFTEEPFTNADLIVLQDPKKIESRDMAAFFHVKEHNQRAASKPAPPGKTLDKQHSTQTPSVPAPVALPNAPSTPSTAVTSTAMPTRTKGEAPPAADERSKMFAAIKTAGKVTIRTNRGDLHFELHCNKTPLACFNFLTLARRGYYSGVAFHRLIPGFMVQGGDPSGTGTGGESVYGAPFEDEFPAGLRHAERGTLSMANRGRRTNTSQFFVTFAPQPHLDRVHTVFGRLIGGFDVLDEIERTPIMPSTRPARKLAIQDVIIVQDPFEEYRTLGRKDKPADRRADTDPTLMVKRAKASANTPSTIGKYMRR